MTTLIAKLTLFGDHFWAFIPLFGRLTIFGDHFWAFIPLFGRLTIFGDHFWAFIPLFGTCMQNWDFFGTKFGLWSRLGPSPKFGTSLKRLILERNLAVVPRYWPVLPAVEGHLQLASDTGDRLKEHWAGRVS